LNAWREPTGSVGTGILVEPITAVAGLTFDRVYLLGLEAGAYPTPPPGDPFFPVGGPDPLRQRARHRERDRRDYLVALATADGGTVTLSVPDSDGQRATTPSPWLLSFAEQLLRAESDGQSRVERAPLDTAAFRALAPSERCWLRVVFSAQHGVETAVAAADLEDRRLAEVARWPRTRDRLARHPLARREDLPLGAAHRLGERRRSHELTEFDGNVSSVATGSRRVAAAVDGRKPTFATAIETWATCGFRYFLQRVLKVESTLQPEELWTLAALDRGELIHQVLAEFFATLAKEGRPRRDEEYGPSDVALIERLAEEQFATYADRGATGHPVAWRNVRRAILDDLRAFLAADVRWRAKRGLRPIAFEQRFGYADGESWPAVDVPVGNMVLKFRGKIDRIDLDPTGRAAWVFDYKTGSSGGYASFDDDPVAAGQHVQIALYTRVVRERFPQLEQVGGAYWFATRRGGFERREMTADVTTVDQRLSNALEIVVRGIRTGSFPQVPGVEDRGSFAHCHYCDFDRICPARRDSAWQRKQSDPIAAIVTELGASLEEDDDA
jgi:RecB family exonuclease